MLTAKHKETIRFEIGEAWDRIKTNIEAIQTDLEIIEIYEVSLNEDAVIRPRLMAVKPDVEARDRGCAIQLVSSTREKPSS